MESNMEKIIEIEKREDYLVYDLGCLQSDKSLSDIFLSKMIFKLSSKLHIKMMAEFVEDFQKKKLANDLAIKLCRGKNTEGDNKFHPIFWPSTWRIHVCFHKISKFSLEEDFPYELWTLPNVDVLSVTLCDLKKLPDSIGLLKSLRVLDLTNNKLEYLPFTLQFCKDLVELRVEGNYLECLPAFIMKMEKLNCITRHRNYRTVHYYTVPRDVRIPICDSKEENAENKEETRNISPPRLYHLSAIESLKLKLTNGTLSFKNLGIPQSIIIDLLCLFPDLKFCYNCNCGFTEKDYKSIYKCFDDFRGYKNSVFQAVVCGSFCADVVLEQWNLIAEKEKSADVGGQYCFDVEQDGDESERPPTNTMPHNFLRKLICFQ